MSAFSAEEWSEADAVTLYLVAHLKPGELLEVGMVESALSSRRTVRNALRWRVVTLEAELCEARSKIPKPPPPPRPRPTLVVSRATDSLAGASVLAVDRSWSTPPASAVALPLTPPPQDGTPDNNAALIADYRHACEEWGATMLDSWHDRVIELEDKLLASLAETTEKAAIAEKRLDTLWHAIDSNGGLTFTLWVSEQVQIDELCLDVQAADSLSELLDGVAEYYAEIDTQYDEPDTSPPESPLPNPITTEAP